MWHDEGGNFTAAGKMGSGGAVQCAGGILDRIHLISAVDALCQDRCQGQMGSTDHFAGAWNDSLLCLSNVPVFSGNRTNNVSF